MLVLITFAFVAGAATALSPCVLPVLPIALSAGATGGRRRPLGVVAGLVVSFTFAIVALVYVIDALGLPDDLLRKIAIVVLVGFGISLLVPPLAARVEGTISRLIPARRVGPGGDGFWSGVLVGLSLGIVYAPCAGPILAGVITVSASQSLTVGRLAVALAYAVGSAVVLYLLMLGGRRLTSRLTRCTGRMQIAMGAVMVLVAVLMFADYDTRFQTAIANHLPPILVNPSKELEESGTVGEQLGSLRDESPQRRFADVGKGRDPEPDSPAANLPILGTAPDLTGNQRWFNTPGDRPLDLKSLRGNVVLIDFWTYTCINCIRTLPYLTSWDERYRDAGLTIVGVHTPEFPFERDAGNVSDAIDQNGIEYPVAQDNDFATWNAYGNRYWPAKYLIDAKGRVRYTHFGEGEYEQTEDAIRDLLREAGREPGAAAGAVSAERISAGVSTPESYLGYARAERFTNGPIEPGTHDYAAPAVLPRDGLAYDGTWRIGHDAATSAGDAGLELEFGARRVFLVLGSDGGVARTVRVELDGKPIAARLAGADVENGEATVTGQRLYRLVELPKAGRHRLTLDFDGGVSAYAFTFG